MYQLRDIYSIYRCYTTVATYKCNFDNGKIEIVSFVSFQVYVKVYSRHSCICDIHFVQAQWERCINILYFFLFLENPMHEVCRRQIKEQIKEKRSIGMPTVLKISGPNITNMLSIKTMSIVRCQFQRTFYYFGADRKSNMAARAHTVF